MLTGYPLSYTLGRIVLGIGSGVARFLMTAEYATYRYLRCVVNVILLLRQLSVPLQYANFQNFSWGACPRTLLESFLVLKLLKIHSAENATLEKVTKIGAHFLKKIWNTSLT